MALDLADLRGNSRWLENDMASFVAIDFETATASRNSGCAVGLVIVENSEITTARSWLIRPPDNAYDPFNISIHGITPDDTRGEPSFDSVWPEVFQYVGERIVIAHNTSFDISVVRNSVAYSSLPVPEIRFACTYRMAKSTWPDRWSYRLDSLASDLDISLDHHDPKSDAEAAAAIALILCEQNQVDDIEELADKLGYRIGHLSGDEYHSFSNALTSGGASLAQLTPTNGEMDERHPLFGARIAFTGTLDTMTRQAAAQAAVNVGARASGSISKKTNYLVVGMTDFSRVGQDGMSRKLRGAVELATTGSELEIIDENEFLALLGGPG